MTPDAMAALHASAFPEAPWDAQAIAMLCDRPVAICLTDPEQRGFVIASGVADEAEILTIATHPDMRRSGVARALLLTLICACQSRGITHLFLEVAVSNMAARGLYANTGFVEAGLRKGYYRAKDGVRVDALILRRSLPLR